MKKTLLFVLLLIISFGLNAQVARIGSTNYTTLASAFSAVQNGDTIVLLSNVTQTLQITINRAVSFVVEGNGKSITRNANISAFSFSTAASVTFQNTTFLKGSSASTNYSYRTFSLQDYKNAKLTLKNCQSSDYNTLYVGDNDTVNIDGGTFSGTNLAYYNYGNLNIYNGTYSGTYLAYYNYGSLNIYNGTYSGSYLAYYNYATLNIDSGTFKVTNSLVYSNGNNSSSYSGAALTIADGTFTQSNYLVQNNYRKINFLGGNFNTKYGFTNQNTGKVSIKGGTFKNTYYFASNTNGGKISIEDALSFTSGSSSLVFQNDLTGVTTLDEYYFYPSKSAVGHVETRLREPAVLSYYVADTLYQTTNVVTGPVTELAVLPVAPGHVYTHWVDENGNPVVLNETTISGDTRFDAGEGEAVARIGDVFIGNLKSAFSYASNLDTIVLLKDVDQNSTIKISKDISFVFDGNGKTINNLCAANGNPMFDFTTGASASFQNVKIKTNESTAESSYSTLITMLGKQSASLTLKDCELQDYNIFRIDTSNQVTVDGGSLQAYNSVADTNQGKLHLINGLVSAENDFVTYNYGSIQIDNGILNIDDALIDYNYDTLIVEDGQFDLNYVVYENIGGFVNLQDGHYNSDDYIIYDNYNRTAAGEADSSSEPEPTSVRGKVLVNGGTYITEDQWLYYNYGDVEIDNLSATISDNDFIDENYACGNIIIHNATVRADGDLVDSNYGQLVLEAGEYKAGYGIDNYGKLVIGSCHLVCGNDCIYNSSEGKVNVLGLSTFDAPGDSDGAFYSNLDSITVADGYYFYPSKDAVGHVEVRPVADHQVVVYYYANGSLYQSVSVEPGAIASVPALPENTLGSQPYTHWADENGTLFEAGTFVGDTTNVYAMVENAVARIGGTQFATLQDAFNAVAENDTIHLLCNVALDTTAVIGNPVAFTFEGHNFGVSINSTDPVFGFTAPANASFQNATVTQNQNSSDANCFHLPLHTNASLNVMNCDLNSQGSIFYVDSNNIVTVGDSRLETSMAIAYNNYGTLHIVNGDVSSDDDLVSNNYGKLLIDDGYFIISDAVVDNNYDTLVVKNGTIIAGYLEYSDYGGYLNIQDGYYQLDTNLIYYLYVENGRNSNVLINNGTFKIESAAFDDNYGGNIHIENGNFTYSSYFFDDNYKDDESGIAPSITVDNGTFLSSNGNTSDFIYSNYGTVNIHCEKIVCGGELIDDNYGPVTLDCGKVICGSDLIEDNYGAPIHIINGDYEYYGYLLDYNTIYNDSVPELTIDNGTFFSAVENGYDGIYENHGVLNIHCQKVVCGDDFIAMNYGTATIECENVYSDYSIVNENFGTAIILGGNYESKEYIVNYNDEDPAVVKILGGTFRSSGSLLNSNKGSALFENVNFTSTENYVIGSNSSTGIIQINSGEYVSEKNYIICGSSSNDGYIILKGGFFKGRDDGISNGSGEVLFDGKVTFETSEDEDGVLYGDTSKITVSPRYVFVPSKDAKGFLQTLPKEPVQVKYFVEDTLWLTEIYYPGETIYDFPTLPTSSHTYDYWMDTTGQRIWNHYDVTTENRIYAHRLPDSVNVTFVDGSNSETVAIANGAAVGGIPTFSSITDPNFYGWHDENMLFYKDTTLVNADVTLTAFYLVGDTVCTFAELKAAVEAEKPVIILCDMIPAEDELEITANTMIAGMNPNCGLYRVPDYLGKVITVYDTVSLTLLGLNVDGKDIPSDYQFIYAEGYYYAARNDEKGYDSITKHYKFADVNIIDCDMHNCNISGYRDGSVVNVKDCNLTMVNSSFTDNHAGGSGGVAYFYQSSEGYSSIDDFDAYYNRFVIRNCVLSNNEASNGGAICLSGSYFWPDTCTNSNGWEDECPDIDGKEVLQHAGLEIWDSEISYNSAEWDSGAIDPNSCLLGLRGNTVISHNTAGRDGGVSYAGSNSGMFLMYENSMLAYNTARTGGAIYCSEYSFQLHDNSKICFNRAIDGDGGAIYLGWSVYLCKISDNASIFGNTATSHGGGIYVDDDLIFESGLIYGNSAEQSGNDIYNRVNGASNYSQVEFPTSFPSRRYDSDTTGRQTIWVDPIPGVATPGYVLIPYLNYYKDEEDNRYFNPHTSIIAPMSYILAGGSDVNTVWYGLLLDYDANHGTGENYVAEQAVPENGQMVVDTNMFTYPLHKFLGWNTEPDGSGTHFDPADTITFTDHSQILYAEWCDTKTDTLFVTSCTQYEWNGVVYTEAGIYDLYFEDAGDCDSISTLVLTLAATPLQVEITPDSHIACSNTETILSAVVNSTSENLSYVWSNDETTESITVAPTATTTYSLIVTDEFGCEGKDTVEITIAPSYNQEENLTLCQNELPYTWRDTTFQAGTVTDDYVFNRHTVNGCDSIVTLHLTVNPSYNESETATICQSELPYTWRDTTFNAGTVTDDYVFHRQTANGCDSIVTLHLTVNPSYNESETATICQSELPYDWRDTTFQAGTVTGDYVFNRLTVNGCDSIVTLHLTVNPSYDQSESLTICQNELPYTWRDTTFQTGTVTDDYLFNRQTVDGCDSIVTLHLTVTPSYYQSESLTLCQNELPYTWRDTTFQTGTITGDYVFSRQTVDGCDSIVTLHLTVNPAALNMDDLTDYIRCNGGVFSVTPMGSIPEGTLYTWTVEDNAYVTGQSAQTTLVAAPISQTLTNNSGVAQTVIYHVTPMTNDCPGDEFTITVEVEPTPELTLTCPGDITRTLEFGSCALLLEPEDLGTPTWAHSLGWVLIDITNDAPADNMYPEGDNVITWTMTDECGNSITCEQHVFVIFPECPDAVDYEGNVYHGVRIDCDCWTQRNLESHQYSDGSDIPGIYSYISDMYPDSAANAGTFGLLYDWDSAIKDGQDNGYGHVQGICPEGWYLPTDEKYAALNAHGAAALKSPDYWLDGGGNNSTGFTSLPAGYYDGSIGRYLNLMGEAYYWSTTRVNGEIGSSSAVIRYICNEVLTQETREGLGYSVRCIKEKE